ncbi:hypothetical protein CRUP_012727, partial [Coryphaenoides rupestris]
HPGGVTVGGGGAWDASDRGVASLSNASRRNYFRCRSGRALYVAICTMHQQQAPPTSSSCSSYSGAPPPGDSSLVLREVLVLIWISWPLAHGSTFIIIIIIILSLRLLLFLHPLPPPG